MNDRQRNCRFLNTPGDDVASPRTEFRSRRSRRQARSTELCFAACSEIESQRRDRGSITRQTPRERRKNGPPTSFVTRRYFREERRALYACRTRYRLIKYAWFICYRFFPLFADRILESKLRKIFQRRKRNCWIVENLMIEIRKAHKIYIYISLFIYIL